MSLNYIYIKLLLFYVSTMGHFLCLSLGMPRWVTHGTDVPVILVLITICWTLNERSWHLPGMMRHSSQGEDNIERRGRLEWQFHVGRDFFAYFVRCCIFGTQNSLAYNSCSISVWGREGGEGCLPLLSECLSGPLHFGSLSTDTS